MVPAVENRVYIHIERKCNLMAMQDDKREKDTMTNFTLRLPADLRRLAEEAAAKSGRTLADELRLAIASFFSSSDGLVTAEMLRQKLDEHVRSYHVVLACADQASLLPPPPQVDKQEEMAGMTNRELRRARDYLAWIEDALSKERAVTPSEVSKHFGDSSRRIGRILRLFGVKAQNTRINNISARWIQPHDLPVVRAALERVDKLLED